MIPYFCLNDRAALKCQHDSRRVELSQPTGVKHLVCSVAILIQGGARGRV